VDEGEGCGQPTPELSESGAQADAAALLEDPPDLDGVEAAVLDELDESDEEDEEESDEEEDVDADDVEDSFDASLEDEDDDSLDPDLPAAARLSARLSVR
jgi:hypothetical protein